LKTQRDDRQRHFVNHSFLRLLLRRSANDRHGDEHFAYHIIRLTDVILGRQILYHDLQPGTAAFVLPNRFRLLQHGSLHLSVAAFSHFAGNDCHADALPQACMLPDWVDLLWIMVDGLCLGICSL